MLLPSLNWHIEMLKALALCEKKGTFRIFCSDSGIAIDPKETFPGEEPQYDYTRALEAPTIGPRADRDVDALARLNYALAQDILAASDESILAEVKDDGGDVAAIAAATRAVFEQAVLASNKALLTAARAAPAADLDLRFQENEAFSQLANSSGLAHAQEVFGLKKKEPKSNPYSPYSGYLYSGPFWNLT